MVYKGLIVDINSFPDIFQHFVIGVMIRSLEGADAGAQYLGNLLVRGFVVITHREYHPLLRRQGGNSLLQSQLQLVAIKIAVGLEQVSYPFRLIRQGECASNAFPAKEGERLVCGYPPEPGEQTAVATEVIHRAPRLHKGILQQVIGILMQENQPAYMPVEAFTVDFNYLVERLFLSSGPVQPDYVRIFDQLFQHRLDLIINVFCGEAQLLVKDFVGS